MKWISPTIVAGLLIYILYMHSCEQLNCPEVISTSDTVRVTTIDTLFFEKVATNTKGKAPVVVGPAIDDSDAIDTALVKSRCDSTYRYSQEYEDSLISGTLFANVRGTLLSSNLIYTPKFPKYIYRTDSIIVTNTNTVIEKIYQRPYGFIVGGGILIDEASQASVAFDVGVQLKQGIDLTYRYNPLRSEHGIGVTYTFQFKPKK